MTWVIITSSLVFRAEKSLKSCDNINLLLFLQYEDINHTSRRRSTTAVDKHQAPCQVKVTLQDVQSPLRVMVRSLSSWRGLWSDNVLCVVTGRCSLRRGQLLIWRLLCSHVRVCTGHWIAKWFDVFIAERLVYRGIWWASMRPASRELKTQRRESRSDQCFSVKTRFCCDERMNIRLRLDQSEKLVTFCHIWTMIVLSSCSASSVHHSYVMCYSDIDSQWYAIKS